MVGAVAIAAGLDTAFHLQFVQGTFKGKQGVSGRGVTKLSVFFEAFKLGHQVQTEASGHRRVGFQTGASCQDDGKAWNSLKALIG